MTGSLPFYVIPVLAGLGVIIVVAVIYLLLRSRARNSIYLQDPLFDGSSRSFYGLIDVAVRDHFNLFRNVAITDVVRHSGMVSPLSGSVRHGVFDLLLCDRRKMLPKCAIVLVDRNNPQDKTMSHLRGACDLAGLPLLVYETGRMLDVRRIRQDIYQAAGMHDLLQNCGIVGDARGQGYGFDGVEGESHEVAEQHHELEDDHHEIEDDHHVVEEEHAHSADAHRCNAHRCKKCGANMELRKIAKGQHAGAMTWVCETFPECRFAVLADDLEAHAIKTNIIS